MTAIAESKCTCGEAILIEKGSRISSRTDGVRPHYQMSEPGSTQFRCRACHGWVADTVPGAEFVRAAAAMDRRS